MNKYFEYEIPLSENQLQKLQSAINRKRGITLQIGKKDINSKSNLKKLMLTKTQINKIEKHKSSNTGVEISLSVSQLKKNQIGGLIPLLPILAKIGSVAAPLAISAVSGLVNSAANAIGNKIAGNGLNENVSINIPRNDLQEILNYVHILENKNILPNGSRTATERNLQQNGGAFVLPLIASLLGTFLPTLFNQGKGIYLPWESKN